MCGFVGYAWWNGTNISERRMRLHSATRQLAHRGPDDEAFYLSTECDFGFRRLKIIDLSDRARQPMGTEDGRYWLVFNGEIYNYVELRERLAGLGVSFATDSDSEVLLKAFQHWGPACLEKLNGMFAFAIWDAQKEQLFLARDRFGEKPLYYVRDGDAILFASEIKALHVLFPQSTDWNPIAVRNYLQRGYSDLAPVTFFNRIQSLPASHFLQARRGAVEVRRYWDLELRDDLRDPVPTLRDLFLDSIRLRSRSDVPLGTCLSGGLDSGSIVCALNAIAPQSSTITRKTFTAAYREFDEAEQVAAVNAATGSIGYSVIPCPRSLDDIAEILAYHDEPFHSMAVFASYSVMRLARENGVTVLLNGQGADELLAGYGKYLKYYCSELIRRGKLRKAVTAMVEGQSIGSVSPVHTAIQLFRGWIRDAGYRWLVPERVSRVRRDRDAREEACMEADFVRDTSSLPEPPLPPKCRDRLKQRLYASAFGTHLQLYLRVEDRNSMAHSLESRLPFLDHRFAEAAFSIPTEWFMNGGQNKYVLREGMRGILPDVVRDRRPKYGFPVPADSWLRQRFRSEAREILNDHIVQSLGIFDVPRLLQEFDRYCEGGAPGKGGFFWRVLMISMWWTIIRSRRYIRENKNEPRAAMNVVNAS